MDTIVSPALVESSAGFQRTASLGLLGKIRRRQGGVGVIGLGHVGLALAGEFARVRFSVTGVEIKPFGPMRFYLGPGLDGHCILIDPAYLTLHTPTLSFLDSLNSGSKLRRNRFRRLVRRIAS
jgi:hypothetical protein